jgi:hypothetical protein
MRENQSIIRRDACHPPSAWNVCRQPVARQHLWAPGLLAAERSVNQRSAGTANSRVVLGSTLDINGDWIALRKCLFKRFVEKLINMHAPKILYAVCSQQT